MATAFRLELEKALALVDKLKAERDAMAVKAQEAVAAAAHAGTSSESAGAVAEEAAATAKAAKAESDRLRAELAAVTSSRALRLCVLAVLRCRVREVDLCIPVCVAGMHRGCDAWQGGRGHCRARLGSAGGNRCCRRQGGGVKEGGSAEGAVHHVRGGACNAMQCAAVPAPVAHRVPCLTRPPCCPCCQQKAVDASRIATNHHATLVKAEKTQHVLVHNVRVLRRRVVLAERRLRAWYASSTHSTRHTRTHTHAHTHTHASTRAHTHKHTRT